MLPTGGGYQKGVCVCLKDVRHFLYLKVNIKCTGYTYNCVQQILYSFGIKIFTMKHKTPKQLLEYLSNTHKKE